MFYVYTHKVLTGPRAGDVFYVGKGCGYRANAGKRNFLWLRMVEKYGYDTEIVCKFDDESEAYDYEALLIAEYRAKGAYLTNLTTGGANCKYGQSSRDKIGAALRSSVLYDFYNEQHGDVRCTQFELQDVYGVQQGNISSLISGKRMSANGWVMKGGKLGKPTHGKKYEFCHDDYGCLVKTQADMLREFGLHHQSVSDVVRGKSKSHRGWTLKGVAAGPQKNLVHKFYHNDHGTEFCTQAELVKKYGLMQSHLSGVVRGVRNHHNGWRVK